MVKNIKISEEIHQKIKLIAVTKSEKITVTVDRIIQEGLTHE